MSTKKADESLQHGQRAVRRSVPHSVASDRERTKQLHFLDPKTSATRDAEIENASELVDLTVGKLPPPQSVSDATDHRTSREHTKQLHFLNPKNANKRNSEVDVDDVVPPQGKEEETPESPSSSVSPESSSEPSPQEQALPMDPEKLEAKRSLEFMTKEQRLAAEDARDRRTTMDVHVMKEAAAPGATTTIANKVTRHGTQTNAQVTKEVKVTTGEQYLTPEQRMAAQDAKDKVGGTDQNLRIAGYLDGSSKHDHNEKNLRIAGYLDGSSNQNQVGIPLTGAVRRVESTPGAVAVGRLDGSRYSIDASYNNNNRDVENGMLMEESQKTHTNHMDDSKAGLARAMPVLDESVKHQADEVGLEVLEEEDEKRFKRREETTRKNILMGFFGVSLLIVAVAIGIVVGLRQRDDSKSSVVVVSSPTTAPSAAPSLAPSAAPTAYILDFPNSTLEALGRANSPQSRAYSWLLNDPHLDTYPEWRQMQRFAMVTFFHSTGGETTWERNDNWLDYEVSECDWLNKGNMRLQLMDIKGTFSQLLINLFLGWYRYNPREDFGSFWEGGDELEYYDFPCGASPEQEQGDPDAHSRLRRFWLHNNMLSGIIPNEIGLLTSMEDWGMAHNPNLRGTLPTQLGNLRNLQYVGIEDCGFETQLPTEIGLLTNARTLSLVGQPGLRGKVPSEIGLLSDRLMYFDIPILEPLPTEIGLLTNLEFFSPQSSCEGMGSIPSQMGLLTKLRLMNIIDAPMIDGEIPTELGQLSLLEMGQIRGTAVSGSIPTVFGQLRLMKVFLMDRNSLTGSLPSELALMTDLEEFVVAANPLEGPLPQGFGDATYANLELFSLAETLVTGSIPDHSCPFAVFDCSESLCGCDCTCSNTTASP